MQEHIQPSQPSTEFADGDELNLHAAQEGVDSYEVGHERAQAAERAATMERPLAHHEIIGETTRLVINIRLKETLERQAPTHNPDDYELIN